MVDSWLLLMLFNSWATLRHLPAFVIFKSYVILVRQGYPYLALLWFPPESTCAVGGFFTSEGDVIAGVDFVLRPLDEAAGYVASAGKFQSPEMLKLYYHLLRKKLGTQFIQTPFYIKHPNKGGYELGLAYFAGAPKTGSDAERKANQACTGLSKYKIQCEVQYQDFKY